MLLFYEQVAGELSKGQCEGEPVRAYSEGNLFFIIVLCNIVGICSY